ncbi:MAG: SseB family protein [Pseudomonadota bacterium]
MSDETTPLDQAHQALLAAPDDDRARLAFHERLADSELFIVLEEEPKGDRIVPVVMDTSSVPLILAFDRDARMAAFIGGVTPYAALPGRRVVEMLRGSGHGIALNLGVPDGETIVPPESVDWLGGLLRDGPAIGEGRITRLEPPKGLPEALLTALDQKLATMGGLAEAAWLTGVVYEAGARSHALAFIGAPEGAQRAIALAVNEALHLSGLEAGQIDVLFPEPDGRIMEGLTRVGLRFDLPKLHTPAREAPQAPGSDPSKPPILK